MVAPTSTRVEQHTKPEINAKIRRQAERNLAYYEQHPKEIRERVEELDREWDTERVIQTHFGALTLVGALASLRSKWWLILPSIAGGFMINQAIQGWCPPVPILRRAGVRTAREIEKERCELERMVEKK